MLKKAKKEEGRAWRSAFFAASREEERAGNQDLKLTWGAGLAFALSLVVSLLLLLGAPPVLAQAGEETDLEEEEAAPQEATGRGQSSTLQPAALPESALEPIEDLNVRGADLRDLLRAVAEAHRFNLVVDDAIDERVTTRLTDVPAARAVAFLAGEYGLNLSQTGNIIRVSKPEPEEEPPDVEVLGGRLSADLSGVPLREVARALSKEGDANVVVGQGASGPISGYLEAAPFEAGLASLMQENGFEVTEEAGIYTVRAVEGGPAGAGGGARRRRGGLSQADITVEDGLISIEAREAPARELLSELASRLGLEMVTYQAPEGRLTASVSGLSLEEALGYVLRGSQVTYRKAQGGVYVIGSAEGGGMTSSELVRLDHLKAETIMEIMPQELQARAAIKVVTEQNGFVVTGPQEAIARVEAFAEQVDRPTPQIMIEALVVDYNTDDLYELGVRFGKRGPAGEEAESARSTYSFDEGGYELDANGTRIEEYLETLGSVLGGFPGISNIGELPPEFYLQVQALAQEGIAEVRSRPKITTLNGHPASLSIGTTQYYILRSSGGYPPPRRGGDEDYPGGYPSGGGYGAGYESERFERVEANVSLDITPWVTASGEVTVEIAPEFSTPVGSLSPEVPPTINTRTVSSTVRLEDGETIVLGGLIQESKSVTYNEVPILGQIPLLGQLFRSRRHNLEESELVIYLTPHVFYGGEEERRQWREMPDRLGLRDPEAGISVGYTELKRKLGEGRAAATGSDSTESTAAAGDAASESAGGEGRSGASENQQE